VGRGQRDFLGDFRGTAGGILETLNLDARPAFHEKQERTYFLRIFDLDVAWEVKNGECVLCGLRNLSDRTQ
tara:strand:- start:257 stop:469 length:213 start_codon:yes stop_codon:yes gene_type:complete